MKYSVKYTILIYMWIMPFPVFAPVFDEDLSIEPSKGFMVPNKTKIESRLSQPPFDGFVRHSKLIEYVASQRHTLESISACVDVSIALYCESLQDNGDVRLASATHDALNNNKSIIFTALLLEHPEELQKIKK